MHGILVKASCRFCLCLPLLALLSACPPSGGEDSGPDADAGDGDPCGPGGCGNRDLEAYPDRGVFLASANDWREVLSLVPVTTWRTESEQEHAACPHPHGGAESTCAYPALIHHEELESGGDGGMDLDSAEDFVDRYEATEVIVSRGYPLGIDAFGPDVTVRILDDPLTLWLTLDKVVLVEEDYEHALVAAPYASLLGAPLLIEGFNSDIDYTGIDVICVGAPTAAPCNEQLTFDQVTQRYLDMTDTKLVVLTDPSDLGNYVTPYAPFPLEHTTGTVSQLFGNLSMASPFLAAAKEELLLPFDGQERSAEAVDTWFESRLAALGLTDPQYLTIVGAPNLIPHARFGLHSSRLGSGVESWSRVDGVLYGDLDGDLYQDLRVGRIFSFTISGTSAYVGRVLFHDELSHSTSIAALSSFDRQYGSPRSKNFFVERTFQQLDFGVQAGLCDLGADFDSSLYHDQLLIAYAGHANHKGGDGGFSTTTFRAEQIWLPSTLVVVDGCYACAYDATPFSNNLFCAEMIRRGAIGFIGAVDASSENVRSPTGFMLRVAKGLDFGTAYRDATNLGFADTSQRYAPYMTFIGDPTFDLGLPGGDELDLTNLTTGELFEDAGQWILPVNVHLDPTPTVSAKGMWVMEPPEVPEDRYLDLTAAPFYGGDSQFNSQVSHAHIYPAPPEQSVFENTHMDVVVAFENPQGLSLQQVRSATREIGGAVEDISEELDYDPDFPYPSDVFPITNAAGTTFVKLRLPLGDGFIAPGMPQLPPVDFGIELAFAQ